MIYHFEGRDFATQKEFGLAFPAYRTYDHLLKDGISTVMEMEKAIHAKQSAGMAARLKAARSGAHAAGRSIRFDGRAK